MIGRTEESVAALSEPPEQRMVRRISVAGGSRRALSVRKGDCVRVINSEGGQPCRVTTNGCVLGENNIVEVFGAAARAKEAVDLTIEQDGILQVDLPGVAMAPDAQDPPTDIEIQILSDDSQDRLPDPLASVKDEIRVPAASARCYHVRKGDYIQIIDVSGRQCSDFLAFDAEELKQGREYGLDATATRTFMGAAMPTPGLHSKFLDARLRPLVEVVQDTVGRHDAFLAACAAKYYDDAGYPGHPNCTDNFNACLADFGVAPRAAWPAINFFYNTQVAPCGTITMDEPWSRPGDYVLLRALEDVVCATSSCADDIDPANGWQPTDIHVRIYPASEVFERGMAHRMSANTAPVMTRKSGFHERTSALTARFVDYRGFWLPTTFEGYGPIAEYWACRERACVMDLSALRKFEITGPDADTLMQFAVTRDIRKLAVGQVVYTGMCYAHGGLLDDGTIFRLGAKAFRWVCGDDYCGEWLRELAQEKNLRVHVRNSTNQLANIAVQGPMSRAILNEVLWTPQHQTPLSELKWFRFTIGKLRGPEGVPVIVSRTGYTGELGYEIWCHPDRASEVWDIVWDAGVPHGLVPLGLDALDCLRIEAGLAFANYEFDSETDPFEAGIGFTVAAAKDEDYMGREALLARKAAPRRHLVGLELGEDEPVSHGDPVFLGRARVGVITSATLSPTLRRTIALARVDVAINVMGSTVEIGRLDGVQKRLSARIAAVPAYDPQKIRVRA